MLAAMRPTTEREHLSDRWAAVHLLLADIAAGRDHTPEGDEVGDEERALLAELDRIEGRRREMPLLGR